ncbi:Tubulin like [Ruminococcaceae bacterium P7]|nr:Tubulin like [Ruminococcaceae bacterium P7]
MIYTNLSIAAGGGIIAHSQQAEQEECANVFIGLGGTGISCLREIKKQVYNRLAPDDPKSDVPEYSHIQFVAIDTDASSLQDDNSISTLDIATDFVDISCSDIHTILGQTHVLQQDPSLQWFSNDISILSAQAGAGGVRQVGRLLLIQNIERIVSTIQNKIVLARTGLRDKPVNIHILTGMGGGTGAGTFLDVCYIVQKILKDMALENAITCGYFFLPDVNLNKVTIESVRDYIQLNGFAAMKELDYCMNFENNKGSWKQNYKSFEIKTSEPPVKLAHLITAKDEKGAEIPNGYDYAMNVVVDYVMEFMTKQIVSSQDRLAGNLGLKSHLANFDSIVKMLAKERGARYYYCVLGAANAYIPYKDINSYLAARIFEAYDELKNHNCHDIDTFVSNSGLAYKSLLNELNKAVGAIPMYEVDSGELYSQVQGIDPTIIPQLLTQMLHKRPEILGNYARNRESLTQNTIVKLRDKLLAFCTDKSRGPVYSALLLRNYNTTDRDMIAVIEGYIKENDKNESQARATLELRESELAKALREFQSSNRFNRNNRCKTYVSAVHAYLSQDIKVQLYVEMGEFIKTFKPQVLSLRDEFFSPLIETIDNVAETFKANFDTLNENVGCDNEYAIKIVGLDDESLKESLNDAVDQLDCIAIVLKFVQHLIDNPKKWESRSNDAQISAMVSEFFVNQLNAFTSKSIDSYLQTKFKAPTQAELVNDIYKYVMLELEKKAAPMFWARKTIDQNSKMGYCSVPNTSTAIQGAVNQLHKKERKIQPRSSIMPDRISMLIFYCGVPMFMFKGVDLYCNEYSKGGLVGKHLYEKSEGDDRDFVELCDILPLSLISPDNYSEKIKEFIDSYAKANKLGIIIKQAKGASGNQYDYLLRSIDQDDYDEKMRKMQRLLNENNVDRAKRYIENSENTSLTFNSSILLPNTGFKGYEDSAVRDHVFASLVLTKAMYDQLAVYSEFEKLLEEVRDLVTITVSFEENVNAFTEALCAGVVYLSEDDKYVFNYIKGDEDFPDEYKLTDMDTKPFGDRIPLYSAFTEFVKLDKEDKSEIADKVKSRKKRDEDGCLEYTKKVKEYVTKRADMIKETADVKFRSERKSIYDFIKFMITDIKSFELSLLM